MEKPSPGTQETCKGLGVSLGEINVEKSGEGGGERGRGLTLRGLACPKRVEFRGWPGESLKEFKRASYMASVKLKRHHRWR